jgi:malate/lactate dehydrogenase
MLSARRGRAPLSASGREKIFHGARGAAAQVIAAKGAANWAVGLAVARIPRSHPAERTRRAHR